jgi:hypothetical protein
MTPHLLALWLAAFGADAATTHIAMRAGAQELILTQRPIANDAILAGEAVLGGWLLHRLDRQHPKVARALTSIGIGMHGAAAVSNVRVTNR